MYLQDAQQQQQLQMMMVMAMLMAKLAPPLRLSQLIKLPNGSRA